MRSLITLAVLAAALAVVAPASAGGWATVTLSSTAHGHRAG